jgi:preprotein translocase subunit SecE
MTTIIQKVNNFFKDVYAELKKVSWLSRNDVVRYTLIVLAVTIIVSAFLGGLDFIFSSLVQKIIFKSI